MENISYNSFKEFTEAVLNSFTKYNAGIAMALDSETAAIVFSYLVAKNEYFKKLGRLVDDRWFYITVDDLEYDTYLPRRKQDSAIEILISCDILEKKIIATQTGRSRYFAFKDNYLLTLMNLYNSKKEAFISRLSERKQERISKVQNVQTPTSNVQNVDSATYKMYDAQSTKRTINNINILDNKDNINLSNRESNVLNCKSDGKTTDATHTGKTEKNIPKIKSSEKPISESEKEACKNRIINELGLESIKLSPEQMNEPKNKLLKYMEEPKEFYCTLITKSAYFEEACGFYLTRNALIDTMCVGYNEQAFTNFIRDIKEQYETEAQAKARVIGHFFDFDNVIGVVFEDIKTLHNHFFVFLKNYKRNASNYYDTNIDTSLNEEVVASFKKFYTNYKGIKRPFTAEKTLFVGKVYSNYNARDEKYRKENDINTFASLFLSKVLIPAYKEMESKFDANYYLQMKTFVDNKDKNGFSKFMPDNVKANT